MSHPNLPVIDFVAPPAILDPRAMPPRDEDHDKGAFTRLSDGELYALAIHEKDTYGRTHSLKNTLHFWQGSEPEFRMQFTK